MVERPHVLCVDDEPDVLEALTDNLRRYFTVTTETSPIAALKLLAHNQYAVLVSDMRMPEMDGAELLARSRTIAPDTTRLLLTGQAELEAAIRAVNEGAIFRFLTKPCGREELVAIITAGAEQHRLITSERVLLEQTLRGAVDTLIEVLGLADPEAFGRASRVKQYATQLTSSVPEARAWKLELAAMLMHIGYVALPQSLAARLANHDTLDAGDMEALDRLPLVAEQLIRPIPRLEEIREIFKAQTRPFGLAGDQALPPEARVLRVAVDYELLESQGMTADLALATLRGRGGRYDPRVIDALARIMGNEDVRQTIRELELDTIEPGMVFAEDVRTASGTLLVARGYAVTYALVERLRGLPPGHTHGPVRMIVDPAPGDEPGGTDAGNARAA